jgi:D-alanyl-D-alanine dipeptidase
MTPSSAGRGRDITGTRSLAWQVAARAWLRAVAVTIWVMIWVTGACALAEPPADHGDDEPPGPTPAGVAEAPAPVAVDLRAAIGDYAANGDTLVLRERDGRLEALIRGDTHGLVPLGGQAFELSGDGAAAGSTLRLEAADDGYVAAVSLDGVAYGRLDYSTPSGQTFRIAPVRPVAELRRAARTATPPVEENHFRAPRLVDLATLDPTIRFDIRYATTDNFMGAVFYDEPRAFLQRPAAEAVLRAHRRLRDHGLGLLIFDAYRPWYVTWMFWHATPNHQKMFVANPASGSRHNRGAAVDLTLYDLATGEPLPMPSGYDEFSPRAFPDYPGGTTAERRNRELLLRVMEAEGFRVYHSEWWHFDHQDWRRYPILNLTFDQIDAGQARGASDSPGPPDPQRGYLLATF